MASALKNVIVVGGSYVGRVSICDRQICIALRKLTSLEPKNQNTAQELARVIPTTHRVSHCLIENMRISD